jgi:SpoVK/Ycf46/Vps4 family AAA+-type ATPase
MSETSREELFEIDIPLPDQQLDELAETLIGFQQRFERVGRAFRALLDPDSVEEWARKHHGKDLPLVKAVAQRYPLALLDGDVGTGKTAFAECAADRLTRATNREGQLMKLSTQVRGVGKVGQLSHLINEAFAAVEKTAGKQRLAFLIIDEGDSLAASRDQDHSHHEDKVGVNTLIQKIDSTRRMGGRLLVFLATNRMGAVDPALLRRVGARETFLRPIDQQRFDVLAHDTQGLGITREAIVEAVRLTAPAANGGVGFTYSDLRTRLLPEAMLKAYPDRALTDQDLLEAARELEPSPPLLDPP